jgi:hypothetical protein
MKIEYRIDWSEVPPATQQKPTRDAVAQCAGSGNANAAPHKVLHPCSQWPRRSRHPKYHLWRARHEHESAMGLVLHVLHHRPLESACEHIGRPARQQVQCVGRGGNSLPFDIKAFAAEVAQPLRQQQRQLFDLIRVLDHYPHRRQASRGGEGNRRHRTRRRQPGNQ